MSRLWNVAVTDNQLKKTNSLAIFYKPLLCDLFNSKQNRNQMGYTEFLKEKEQKVIESGFEISDSKLNDRLFDFQKHVVKKALQKGKYAIFADTGLGKTLMQLEIANQVSLKTGKPSLILAPLAVSGQTINEGDKFDIYIEKLRSDVFGKHTYINNYEQLDNINTDQFECIILDESSILKNESGKYRNLLISKFKETPYKYCFSATPSPNDPMELGNHSEFLDVMGYNEMLAMYFIHDGGQTSKWRLKGHAEDNFWSFVSEWAIMFSHPKDIGFSASGYDLPNLEIKEIQVKTEVPEGMLFGGLAVNATDYNRSLRETEQERINETISIVKTLGKEPIIIWTKQNDEAKNIYKQLTELGYDCRNVQGSDKPEKKESDLLGFGKNEYQILITKQKIASQGLNYQNCRYQIFNSIDFSFEGSYQSIRRSWRFGQQNDVSIWMITTDRMINVVKTQLEKQEQFKKMQKKMTETINKKIDTQELFNNDDVITDSFKLMRGDCVK